MFYVVSKCFILQNGTGENGPSLPQGPHSGSSTGEHDERESVVSPYLTATESKLFAQAGGFNFSMAALAADPNALGGNYILFY